MYDKYSIRAEGELQGSWGGEDHVPRSRNFTIENKFSSEGSLANCLWQFSPSLSILE